MDMENENGGKDMKDLKTLSAFISAAAAACAFTCITAFAAEPGDVTLDGKITSTDIVSAAAHVKSIKMLSEEAAAAADVNNDGSITATDISIIAAHVKGIRTIDGYEAPTPEPEPEPEPEGPVIENIDGVTYVDGILIANKSYPLPSNYGSGLSYVSDNDYGLTPETFAAFKEMQAGAWQDGINLWVCSGYRSYWYQSDLYWSYVNRDGQAEADTYSARPGHSEHQTGLAFDLNYAERWFNDSAEARWIADNCADYGFILRYPQGKEDKTGYIYESWHVRYVGKELARKVTDSGLCLEEYLGIDSYYHD